MQTKPKGHGRHWVSPSGEYCPERHAVRLPDALSHEKPAGQSLHSTRSSVLTKPGTQGFKRPQQLHKNTHTLGFHGLRGHSIDVMIFSTVKTV